MIIDEIKKEVAIENPFELLHKQIAFFGNTEKNTQAVYFSFLDEDGYREKKHNFTFYSFSDFEEKANIQAYMHFGKDNGNIWKENCFKIVLSPKFYGMLEIIKHSRIEVINEENIRQAKEEFRLRSLAEAKGEEMSKQSEERLFIGITPNGIKTCREFDIVENAKHGNINALYYAMLPTVSSKDWHNSHTAFTFKMSERRLVVYQKPYKLNGWPVVEIDEENVVESNYKKMLYEVKKAKQIGDTITGYEIELEKPLTYVFIYELPKFVVDYKNGKYVLRPAKSLGEIIYRIEENFCSKENIDQHYRNNAPDDFDDYHSIGCGHSDD